MLKENSAIDAFFNKIDYSLRNTHVSRRTFLIKALQVTAITGAAAGIASILGCSPSNNTENNSQPSQSTDAQTTLPRVDTIQGEELLKAGPGLFTIYVPNNLQMRVYRSSEDNLLSTSNDLFEAFENFIATKPSSHNIALDESTISSIPNVVHEGNTGFLADADRLILDELHPTSMHEKDLTVHAFGLRTSDGWNESIAALVSVPDAEGHQVVVLPCNDILNAGIIPHFPDGTPNETPPFKLMRNLAAQALRKSVNVENGEREKTIARIAATNPNAQNKAADDAREIFDANYGNLVAAKVALQNEWYLNAENIESLKPLAVPCVSIDENQTPLQKAPSGNVRHLEVGQEVYVRSVFSGSDGKPLASVMPTNERLLDTAIADGLSAQFSMADTGECVYILDANNVWIRPN